MRYWYDLAYKPLLLVEGFFRYSPVFLVERAVPQPLCDLLAVTGIQILGGWLRSACWQRFTVENARLRNSDRRVRITDKKHSVRKHQKYQYQKTRCTKNTWDQRMKNRFCAGRYLTAKHPDDPEAFTPMPGSQAVTYARCAEEQTCGRSSALQVRPTLNPEQIEAVGGFLNNSQTRENQKNMTETTWREICRLPIRLDFPPNCVIHFLLHL